MRTCKWIILGLVWFPTHLMVFFLFGDQPPISKLRDSFVIISRCFMLILITDSLWTQFDQTSIGLAANDTGGELDPHGDDNLGNPVGGL